MSRREKFKRCLEWVFGIWILFVLIYSFVDALFYKSMSWR